MPAISFTAWARTAQMPPTPMSPPCLSAKSAVKPALCPPARFHKNCVAPFPAKATSVRAGKAATATARHLSSTATMKLGIQTKKSTTAPPCNSSIPHWHNPCLIKIRFRRPSKHTRPCRPALRQPRPLARCRRTRRHRRHAVRLRQAGIGQKLPTRQYPLPLPAQCLHQYGTRYARPGDSPHLRRRHCGRKYSACPIRYRKG